MSSADRVSSADRPEPPYLRVVRAIRDDVVSGRLAEGDAVPSARKIAADWGIALATATKALNALRAEGLVRGVPGVGTVVTRGEHRTRHRGGLACPARTQPRLDDHGQVIEYGESASPPSRWAFYEYTIGSQQ